MIEIQNGAIYALDYVDIQLQDVQKANEIVARRRDMVRVIVRDYRDICARHAASRDMMDRAYLNSDVQMMHVHLVNQWHAYRRILKFSHALKGGYLERLGVKD